MSIPTAWVVQWTENGKPESLPFTQRARMRGFVLMLKARGVSPIIVTPEFRQ